VTAGSCSRLDPNRDNFSVFITITMPSDQSTWLLAVPQDGDAEGLLPDVTTKLTQQSRSFPANNIAELNIPSFKVWPLLYARRIPYLTIAVIQAGTLDSLISLSEDLPKQDAAFTAIVAKTVDTLRNLLNNDPSKLAQHVQVNEGSVDGYLLGGWRWNEGRYGVQRGLREMVDILIKVSALIRDTLDNANRITKEMTSIDNAMKAKLNNYNIVKGSLTQMQRKKL
jgi:V-type H+-transporting ATPase subunit C